MTSLPDGSFASEILISGSPLLEAIANLAAVVANKQSLISVANPIPSINFVYGLGEALSNAASTVVTIDSVPNLAETLANKQPLLGPRASVQLASLTCSLLKATAAEQSLRLSDPNGLVLLTLDNAAATFLRSISAPSLDISGTLLCSQSAVIGGPLYVGGIDVMTATANAGGGSTIDANTQLAG